MPFDFEATRSAEILTAEMTRKAQCRREGKPYTLSPQVPAMLLAIHQIALQRLCATASPDMAAMGKKSFEYILCMLFPELIESDTYLTTLRALLKDVKDLAEKDNG
jgi:hypothetical protein